MELRHFLAQQEGAGEWDSADGFTLNALKSQRKLAQHQLPERGLWLVKLVQGAVALHAQGVKIELKRRLVTVEFISPEGPGADSLLGAVFSGKLFSDRVMMHLTTGLRACVGDNTETLTWAVRDAESGARVVLSPQGAEIEELEPVEDGQTHYRFDLGRPKAPFDFKRALRKRVVDLVNEVADEYTAVVGRCWCSPIPIELDGRALNPGFPHPSMRYLADCEEVGGPVDRYQMGDHWLAVRPLRVRGFMGPPGWEEASSPNCGLEDPILEHKVGRGESFLRWSSREEGSVGLFVSFASLNRPGVDYIMDGAVVDQVSLDYHRPLRASDKLMVKHQRQFTSFRLFVAVDPTQLDLSQFRLREHAAYTRELIAGAKIQLLETLNTLEERLDGYRFSPIAHPLASKLLAPLVHPLVRMNDYFTISEAKRTLGQLRDFLRDSGEFGTV